jgi:hypothetical protein
VLVVADCNNHRLALWRLCDGTVWRHLGSHGTEPGQFSNPLAVAVTSAGALVVSDRVGDDYPVGRVQVLTVDGIVLCVLNPAVTAGVGPLGPYINGLAVCEGTNDIIITDMANRRVVLLTWV